MFNKFLMIFLLSFLIANCSAVSEWNEKAKGDGVPYLPGI